MSVPDFVRAFEGVSLDGDGAISFEGVPVGSVSEAGGMLVIRLLTHLLDAGPLCEEYPFIIPGEEGWLEIILGGQTDDAQAAALMECLNSAADRVREAR